MRLGNTLNIPSEYENMFKEIEKTFETKCNGIDKSPSDPDYIDDSDSDDEELNRFNKKIKKIKSKSKSKTSKYHKEHSLLVKHEKSFQLQIDSYKKARELGPKFMNLRGDTQNKVKLEDSLKGKSSSFKNKQLMYKSHNKSVVQKLQ